jgi:hypothetical protein
MTVLPGSLRDFVMRAKGRPIYCTAPGAVRRALMALAIETFRREVPEAEFVNALTFYRNRHDRHRRWPQESASYGAAIVVTRAEAEVPSTDAFDNVPGEHSIDERVSSEIDFFVARGRPIAWLPVDFPEMFWVSRFAVTPREWISTSQCARILPAADAELFHPNIKPLFGEPVGNFAALFRDLGHVQR